MVADIHIHKARMLCVWQAITNLASAAIWHAIFYCVYSIFCRCTSFTWLNMLGSTHKAPAANLTCNRYLLHNSKLPLARQYTHSSILSYFPSIECGQLSLLFSYKEHKTNLKMAPYMEYGHAQEGYECVSKPRYTNVILIVISPLGRHEHIDGREL